MTKIKYDIRLMKYISIFESITKTNVKDCIDGEDVIVFVVNENNIGKAIGRNGINVKSIEKKINRKIKILGFNPELILFVKNLVYPIEIKDVTVEEGIVTVTGTTTESKSMLIGRERKNLRKIESIAKRYFDIKEIKVI